MFHDLMIVALAFFCAGVGWIVGWRMRGVKASTDKLSGK
jgi:hypothetical protein